MNLLTKPRLALILSALLASPAWAQITTVYPGTMCTFDGPVELPISGALMNASDSTNSWNTTSKAHCPVPRLMANAAGKTLRVKVNVLRNNHLITNPWECWLRTASETGAVIQQKVFILEAANYTTPATSFILEISNLSSNSRSYNLRCNVPDKTTTMAGIVSYEVTE